MTDEIIEEPASRIPSSPVTVRARINGWLQVCSVRIRRHWSVTLLEAVTAFSIIWTAVAYVRGADERANERAYQAWQVIHIAQDQPGSGGRLEALTQLLDAGQSLEAVDVSGSNIGGIRLPEADLRRGDFSGAFVDSAYFVGADISEVDFSRSDIELTNFDAVRAFETDFRGAQLSRTSFRQDADLFRTDFGVAFGPDPEGEQTIPFRTQAVNARFDGARLLEANLSGIEAEFSSFRDADLTGADVTGAVLQLVDLRNANLAGVNLRSAGNIDGTNLAGVQNLALVVRRWALDSMNAVEIADDSAWADFRRGSSYTAAIVRDPGAIPMPRRHYRVSLNCAPIRGIFPDYGAPWCVVRDSIPDLLQEPRVPQ